MSEDIAPSLKTLVSGLSGRYALALFELAEERNLVDKVEADLALLETLLEISADMGRLVHSPSIGREDAKSAVAGIAAELSLSEVVGNFLGVLASNRRLPALGRIITDFRRLSAARRGEIATGVTSAAPLSKAQLAALSARLKQLAGREVTLDLKVDPSLIGGLVVKLGSRMIDGSVATRLTRLERAMKGM